ncbi:MAG: hypothetical protein ACXADH_02970, partial [Candidatus Kariarchaeaceae archaeon]
MKSIIRFGIAVIAMCFCAEVSFAQNTITVVPDTIKTAGQYTVTVDTLKADTTGVGSVRAAIWVTSQPDSSRKTPGVDNVSIDGQGAHLIGVEPSNV